MRKQKKQLLTMLVALILAVAALVLVLRLPEEETDEGQDYQVSDLDKEMINRLSFANDNGMYSFTKLDEEWIYEDDKELDIDESVLESMIAKIAVLTSQNCIQQVEDPAQYGLDEPTATILISDGTTGYTICVGDYNELTGTYYLCLESDEETVYTTDPYTVSDFLEKGIDDLIVEDEALTE